MAGENPQLAVEITAGITDLNNNFAKAVDIVDKGAKQIQASTNAIDNSFKRVSQNISNNLKPFDKDKVLEFANSFKSIPQELPKVDSAVKRSGIQFQGFSRILQDVAFGPGAIANNFEGLGNDFRQIGQISRDTGQSIGKVLVNSLTGAGGLNLALGATTLAFSVASFGLQAWTRLFPENKKEVDKASLSTKDYLDTIDAVASAQIKGSQSAQSDLVNVRLLYKAYVDSNIPLKERKNAYSELQKQYPAYFGNLAFEKTASEAARSAYDQLTSSILSSARARAAADAIAKNAGRELENENKRVDARIKLEEALAKRRRAEAFLSGIDKTAEMSGVIAKYQKEISGYNETIISQTKIIRETNVDSSKLTENNLRLEKLATGEKLKELETTKEVNKELEKQGKKISEIYKNLSSELKSNTIKFGSSKEDIAEENIKSYQKAIDELVKNGYEPASKAVQSLIAKQKELFKVATNNGGGTLPKNAGEKLIADAQDRLNNRANPQAEIVNTISLRTSEALATLRNEFNYTNEQIAVFVSDYGLSLEDLLSKTQSYNDAIQGILEDGAVNTIGDLGASIGQSFANGANIIEAAAGSILSSIGNILTQFGQLTLSAGIAATALGRALKNPLNPVSAGAAIAAGAALIAVGAAVKSFSSNISKGGNGSVPTDAPKPIRGFATGGFTGRGGVNEVAGLVHRGEYVVPASAVNQSTGLPKSSTMNNMAVGSQSFVVDGEFNISLESLFFRLRDVERRVTR